MPQPVASIRADFQDTYCITLSEAESILEPGDLLLSPWLSIVRTAGRGYWGHASKLAKWDSDWWILELVIWGQAIPLRARVEQMPGKCAIFKANADCRWPDYDRAAAVTKMKEIIHQNLDWKSTLFATLAHTPLWPVAHALSIVPGWTDEYIYGRHCAAACAEADRAGGVDPVPWLADCYTEPSDLARSTFYQYCGHLVP